MVRMKPFRMGKKTWDKAMVTTRLDERSYITRKTAELGAKYFCVLFQDFFHR